MNKNSLGHYLRLFRNQKGISQLDLEMQIGLAAGSISRIESGKSNPTKETLAKIVGALELQPLQVATLFNVKVDDLASLVSASHKIHSSLDLNEILQNAVNSFTIECGLSLAVILLVDGELLRSRIFTQTWYTEAILNLLEFPFEEYFVHLQKHTDNLCVQAVNTRSNIFTYDLTKATKYAMPDQVIRVIGKILKFKIGIAMPLIYNDKVLGTMFYAKDYEGNFDNELPVLESFNRITATAIANAKKFDSLYKEIEKLKKSKS
ncbi:helix-turn-helix domain-containing protein [Candidatus Dojkabacteria bacterium]|uniref:Helix-turn-helix domain-containing protein n=1 Tax=Candidatus Dojkabacteria bacterium TaxID=2099670 RepID=A0A955RKG7_9BACT|nr:helix-turn-helix domain-containing protein [Candidatus Dojkabacteria bacterium]